MITVTIITPVLNSDTYLEECILSVLTQGYPYIEHIFVDGGSIDRTLDILKKYQTLYPDKVRFISEPDSGTGEAWNKGLRIAKGDVFGWLGADDLLLPVAIKIVVDYFVAHSLAKFVYGGCNLIDKDGKIIRALPQRDFNLREMINSGNCIPCPSAFYKREVVEKVGLISEAGNDREYWIRVGKVFPIDRIDNVLSSFRVHEGSATTGASKEKRMLALQGDCRVTRQYGGSIFSYYCLAYYKFVILEALRPCFGFSYSFLKRILGL